MATWRFVLCNAATGAELGEIWEASDRQIVLPLNGLETVSMRLKLDNPMVDVILGSSYTDRLTKLLKAYRNGVLVFVGDLLTGEETADANSQTFGLSAVGPFWRLQHRLVWNAFDVGYSDGTAVAQKNKATLIQNILTWVNAESNSGIRQGTITAAAGLGYIEKVYWVVAAQLISTIAGALDGPDVDFTFEEPTTDGSGIRYAAMNTYFAKGAARPAYIYEYGDGRRNVDNYRRTLSAEGKANSLFGPDPAFPDLTANPHMTLERASDATSITAHTMLQDVLTTDLVSGKMRQDLVNMHVQVRRFAREQIVITPIPNAEPDPFDLLPGDTFDARAKVEGRVRFNATFRCYGKQVSLDESGNETVELTLVNEGAFA